MRCHVVVLLFGALCASTSFALAAPPRCDKITVEAMRKDCEERAKRCEPLVKAADRDECYRGPRSTRQKDETPDGRTQPRPTAYIPDPRR